PSPSTGWEARPTAPSNSVSGRTRSDCIDARLSRQFGQGWEKADAAEPELAAERLDEPLPDGRRPHRGPPLALHRRHRQFAVAAVGDALEQFHVRVDVQGRAEIGDPVVDRDADVGDPAPAGPDASP